MKKLLGIIVLGLLWCNVGFTEVKKFSCERLPGEFSYKVYERIVDTEKKTLKDRFIIFEEYPQREQKKRYTIFEFDEDKLVYGYRNQTSWEDSYKNNLIHSERSESRKEDAEKWNINNPGTLQKLKLDFGPPDHLVVKYTWYYSEDNSKIEYLNTPYNKPSKKGFSKIICKSELTIKIESEEEAIRQNPNSPEGQLYNGYLYYITIQRLYKARKDYPDKYVNFIQFTDAKLKIKEIEKKIEKENEINTDKIWNIAKKDHEIEFANDFGPDETYKENKSKFANLILKLLEDLYYKVKVEVDEKIEKDF